MNSDDSPSLYSLSTFIKSTSTVLLLPPPHPVLEGEASASQLGGPSIRSDL